MQKLNRVLNQANADVKPEQGSSYFKFFVGTGNNYPTVRQIVKRRCQWHRDKRERFIGNYEDEDASDGDEKIRGSHFVWT